MKNSNGLCFLKESKVLHGQINSPKKLFRASGLSSLLPQLKWRREGEEVAGPVGQLLEKLAQESNLSLDNISKKKRGRHCSAGF
ncbi:hypothetical protein I79_020914 [Cricetulus griseus]|uniref:Uncharacterized protein n=1 Tax=Cricetulus griseus TaxID=10029 RepID=G3IB95_CRIGR|nr:hypothetical protein I79_020914 [Cricetulus griseus]